MEIIVKKNLAYRSPVTGEWIRTRAQRAEDLKRHGCLEYEPGMRQDYDRRIADGERDLSAKLSETVETEMARMPGWKRAQLARELLDQGAEATYHRVTKG